MVTAGTIRQIVVAAPVVYGWMGNIGSHLSRVWMGSLWQLP